MFNSFTSQGPTGSHPVSYDETGFSSSLSTFNYNPFPDFIDQVYQYDIDDDILNYTFPSIIDQPSYQEYSYPNYTSNLDNEQPPIYQEMMTHTTNTRSSDGSIDTICTPHPRNYPMEEFNMESIHAGSRIAFRMKTDIDNVDDGYRWRKYGKKKVKSSPNPRNYYRCWVPGCNVKKRVDRDGEDSSYVITTYEGIHNHKNSPTMHHCTTHPTECNFQSS